MEDLTTYTVDEHGAISEPQAVKTYAIPRPEELTTNQKISLAILTKKAAGMSTREAINAVLGDDTFEKLANEIYHELRGEVAHD